MSYNALYTDLSNYYDLMCADIDYQAQSEYVCRLHQLLGGSTNNTSCSEPIHVLDLACGTGPHVQHFCHFGYEASGLDINQPMLDIAQQRCPQAQFTLQDMCNFRVDRPLDLITCFLYSIHYNSSLDKLKSCISAVHSALKPGGVFCFNSVDKDKIDNNSFVQHTVQHVTEQETSQFIFRSNWFYSGTGEKQQLKLGIEKTTDNITQIWEDEHPMTATNLHELQKLLQPYFEVHVFEHDYDKIIPWGKNSGNAIFVCVK